jgi:hypothetical protein
MHKRGITFGIIFVMLFPIFFQSGVQAAAPTIETELASSVTTNQMTLHGYVQNDGGETDITTWFEWCNVGTIGGNTTKTIHQQYDYFSETISGLDPGTLYSYRAVANNTDGTTTGEIRSTLTPPEAPSNMSIVNTTSIPTVCFYISWEHGGGYNRSIVVYNTTASPTSIDEGIVVYNGTNDYVYIGNASLEIGENHYYSVWEYAEEKANGTTYIEISQTYDADSMYFPVNARLPELTTYNATNINSTQAQLNAHLYDGNESCIARFEYTDGITFSSTTNISRNTGYYNETITGLDPGTYYYFVAWGNNSIGSDYGEVKSFITEPKPPQNFTILSYNDSTIELDWDAGEGANTTIIVRKTGNYPSSITDGTIVYEGNATSFSDTNFTSFASQYYRAWSKCEEYGIIKYSSTYESQATLNADFDILFPQYLEVGQYIMAWGMIIDTTGDPIIGYIANTTVQDMDGNVVLGPVHWNCTSGNYQSAIATTSLAPGTYEIVVTFTNQTGVTFTHRNKLFIAIDPTDPGIYVDAWVYYTFYDISTGTGLDDNYYKVYVSHDTVFQPGDRVKGGKIGVIRSTGESITTNKNYYVQIRDFNNNIIPFGEYDSDLVTVFDNGSTQNAYAGFSVTATEFYIDFGVYLNQLRIKNMNSSTVYVILRRTDGNAGQVLGRFIPPWEETEVFIPDGDYNLSVHYYDNNHPEYGPTEIIYPWDLFGSGTSQTITTDLFYWIQGYQLEDVINVVEEEGTWLYYTIFDMNTGSKLEDDFYKVYISEDTTFNSDDRIIGGKYKTSVDNTLHFKVMDYWNNKVYPVSEEYENITIVHTKSFLDVGIPLNQFLIKNVNSSLIYYRITNGNFTDPVNNTWYNRWIPPHESKELFLRTGTYNISIEYYYPHNGQFIRFQNISNLTINQDLFYVVRGKNALVYFNFYNTNNGLGFPYDSLKIYANGIRIPYNHIETEMGSNITLMIRDFYNNILHNETIEIVDPLTYKDLGLTFHSYKFTNDHEDFFIVGLKKEGASIWWEKSVGPYETIEFLPPTGNYSIRVYNASLTYGEFNETVNSTKAFVITGRNFSARVEEILEGQQRVVTTLENQTESFNYTNSLLFETLDLYYYSNETINSVLNIFRQPHVWQVPTVNYTFQDTKPPITTLYAMISLDGEIKVRWHSTDDISGVKNITLYYKLSNATSWKSWGDNLSASGEKMFNDSIEPLVEDKVYWFKAIGVDKEGNIEKERDTNVYNLTYSTAEIDQPVDAGQLVKDALTSWVFFVVAGIIIILVVIVVLIERKQEKMTKEVEQQYPYRNRPRRQPTQQYNQQYNDSNYQTYEEGWE